MPQPESLYVAGTGSWSLEVIEYAQAAGREVLGLVELIDPTRGGATIHDLPVRLAQDLPPNDARAVVIGAGGDRGRWWRLVESAGWGAAEPVVHPRAEISPSASVGRGAIIGPLAVIGAATHIGPHCVVGRGATVGHHVRVNALCVINPGANVGGNCDLGGGVTIGMGATVLNNLRLGDAAVVAAGAVVRQNVEAGVRVQGVPARAYDQ